MANIVKIGFFDSGIGGITVLAEAIRQIPQADYLYYADTDHVPYGTRSREEIRELTTEAVRFLYQQGVQAVVIACNTATSAAIESLRKTFPLPIVGMEPAVKPAALKYRNGKILVAATPATIEGAKLHDLLQKVDLTAIDLLALPKLVLFAEKGDFQSQEAEDYLRQSFADLNSAEYSAIVLGCTHFIFYKTIIAKIMGTQTEIINGNAGTVRQLKTVLNQQGILPENSLPSTDKTNIAFFHSGRAVTDEERVKFYLDLVAEAQIIQS